MFSKSWFAIYTKSRNEKKVHAELLRQGIESYLPLLKILKQWSDRKKWVEEPLFRSYVFVHIEEIEYLNVLKTPGVVRFITFESQAVPIPQRQIDAIRYFIDSGEEHVDPGIILTPGQRVEITRGPLRGIAGQMTEVKGKHKVRIDIEALGQAIHITVPVSNLRVIG